MTIIKICGIKTLQDALSTIEAGADLLGFNFYPQSPRYIEKNICAEITSALKKDYPRIKLVGVFVNSSVEEVNDILQTCSLDFAQLHGDEPPEMLSAFNGKAFKAIRLSASTSANQSALIREFANPLQSPFTKIRLNPCIRERVRLPESANQSASVRESVTESVYKPAFLIDALVKDMYGGSGVKADWNIASELAKQYKFLLAGGLTPENVADAVSRVKPWGVDVASGVESSPGVKDEAKMIQFVKAVRAVENQK